MMDMKEYTADRDVGRCLCRQRRRGTRIYKAGMAVLAVSLACMLAADIRLASRAGGLTVEVFMLAVGVSLPFCLSAFLGFAMMCAPGRELLMRRRWEKCCFTGDAFLLECEPAPHEYEREYDRVVYKKLYQDIRRVEYDEGCKRLAVFGPHTVSRYYTRDGRPCADVFTEDSAPLCVFHYYAEFEEIKARLTYLAAPLRRTAFAP